MNVTIIGAGAVGCYYGGMLARAGHAVTLVGRAKHVDAIRRDGLLLETLSFTERVPVHASVEASAVEGAELVLFCVKSTDTEATATQIAPFIGADTIVCSLQNGVDNAARLQAILRCAVMPTGVYVAAEMAGPGHVRHHGRGELVIGTAPFSEALVDVFATAGVPVRIASNVDGELWAKLIVNCAFNAISALSQQPYGVLFAAPAVRDVMRDLVDECLAVAAALGVAVPGDSWQAVDRIAHTMPGQLSSTAQDIARGKQSEIDYLNGYIVRQGEAAGVPTPANRAMFALVQLVQQQQRRPA